MAYSQFSTPFPATTQSVLWRRQGSSKIMATSAGRGAQTVNSMYFKPMLRKAFHRKSGSPDMISDTAKMNGEEMKNKTMVTNNHDGNWWIPDDRTGIFYPKGQEKVMEDVPSAAGKDFEPINWFANQHTCI